MSTYRPKRNAFSVGYPFVKEAPNHYLSVGAMDDALMAHSPLIDNLKLRDYGYGAVPLAAPYGWMSEDGDTLLARSAKRHARHQKAGERHEPS